MTDLNKLIKKCKDNITKINDREFNDMCPNISRAMIDEIILSINFREKYLGYYGMNRDPDALLNDFLSFNKEYKHDIEKEIIDFFNY